MLEDLGLRVIEEVPTRLHGGDGETWVQDFGVLGPGDRPLDLAAVGERVADCIAAVWRGDDRVRLAQPAGRLGGPGLAPGRRSCAPTASTASGSARASPQSYQNDVLAANPAVTAKLVRYFELRFDPAAERDEAAEARAARGDPRRPRRGRLARPRPHPAQPARR